MPGGVGGEGPGSPVLPYPDSVSWGPKKGLWDPKRDPKNSGCLVGTHAM